jgi:hypothetical protein
VLVMLAAGSSSTGIIDAVSCRRSHTPSSRSKLGLGHTDSTTQRM